MKKMIVIGMVFILIIVISTIVYTNNYNKNNKTTNILQNAESISNNNTINTTENNNVESEGKMNNTIKVSIDGKKYNAIVEQNETTKQFMDMLPKEYNMNELNGNEKYTYLDTTLATNRLSVLNNLADALGEIDSSKEQQDLFSIITSTDFTNLDSLLNTQKAIE